MRENGYFLPHVAIGYPIIVFVALGMWPLLQYVLGVQSDAIILGTMVTVDSCSDSGSFDTQRCSGWCSISGCIRR